MTQVKAAAEFEISRKTIARTVACTKDTARHNTLRGLLASEHLRPGTHQEHTDERRGAKQRVAPGSALSRVVRRYSATCFANFEPAESMNRSIQ